MKNARLNILSGASSESFSASTGSSFHMRRKQAQAKFERLWLLSPSRFNPFRNAMEKERFERCSEILFKYFDPQNKKVADIGCGSGEFCRVLSEKGAHVLAVDVAGNALKKVEEKGLKNVTTHQDYMPSTRLEDSRYDAAISLELIAFLPPDEYRLFFSELSRIISSKSVALCSCPIDIYSDNALDIFAGLAETEFIIEEWKFSYHRLYIRLLDILKIPKRLSNLRKEKDAGSKSKNTIKRGWLKLNSWLIPSLCWKLVSLFTVPLYESIKQSKSALLFLEKICRSFWGESGISHAIFIGRQKPLLNEITPKQPPIEEKQKKRVWE